MCGCDKIILNDPCTSCRVYEFVSSPASLVHVITHNLGTINPNAVVFNRMTNEIILGTMKVISLTQIQFTFAIPIQIRGKIS